MRMGNATDDVVIEIESDTWTWLVQTYGRFDVLQVQIGDAVYTARVPEHE